uniref:glutathione S-transferase theta-3-like n=1 Tax=Myxine glutinosa TaxID=7769 RepID=UPI00358FA870
MAVRLYCDLSSSPSRAVFLLLKSSGVTFSMEELQLEKGENLRSEFLKVTPFQQVPVLEDNGFILTESVAIAKYVVSWSNVPKHWYPEDVKTRARVDEFLSWQHMGLRPLCGLIMALEGVLPAITGCPVPTKRVEAMVSHLDGSLCLLKNYFLAGKAFLCGQQPSLADIFAYCDIQQPLTAGRDILRSHKELQAWRDRLESALGDVVVREANGKLLRGTEALQMLGESEKKALANRLQAKLSLFAG